jgi:DNA-binding NarL/FixJ family response regulator
MTALTQAPDTIKVHASSMSVLTRRGSDAAGQRRPDLRVVVVEHEPLTRAALCDLVQRHPRLNLAGTAVTVAHASELIAAVTPSVVVTDLFLPDGDACGLAIQAAGFPGRPGVVVVTDFATASAAAVCRSVGILTCLTKSARAESLVSAVLAAGDGKSWHGPGAVAAASQPPLSYLQTQVLAEVASGESNEAIARRLGYSVNYVKDLIASARSQLDARDRAHAASLGVALRLLRPVGAGRFVPALPALAYQEEMPERRRKVSSPG